MSDTDPRLSDAARMLAGLVRDPTVFSDDAAQDLKRLLGHTLAAPSTAARRWDTLSLLVSLVHERDGELPAVAEYESARQQCQSDAPAASTLTKRFGSWRGALGAATRLLSVDRSQRAVAERNRYHAPYRPIETTAAIARFHRSFGSWPTHLEYSEWVRIARRAARACGAPDPRLPGIGTVERHYGTFARATDAAMSMYRGSR